MKRTLALPLTALALVAGACTSTADAPEASTDGTDTTIGGTNAPDDGTSEPRGPVGFAPASLQRFGDCDAFIDHVHTEGADRVGPYGFDQGGYFGPEIMVGTDDFAVDEDMAETEAASSAADVVEQTAAPSAALPATSAGDESDFSTTNVQVEGVDEPDIVKTFHLHVGGGEGVRTVVASVRIERLAR